MPHMIQSRVVIEADGEAGWVDGRELWAHRDVLSLLAWRDVAVRYKQTLLGVGWIVLQPVLGAALFSLLFGRMMGVPSDGVPYPLFAYASLLPWTFFSRGVLAGGGSLVRNAELLKKVYFPRLLLPAAAILAAAVDLAVGLGVLVVVRAFSGPPLTGAFLLAPLPLALAAITALAVSIWATALDARYRDVGHALPFLLQLGLFATPVLYPFRLVPEPWRWVIRLNPMTGVLEAFRAAVFGVAADQAAVLAAVAMSGALLATGVLHFRRAEKEIADVI